MIIGLSGRKQSGKDSSAAVLIKELGFRRVAFADKVKEASAAFLKVDPARINWETFKGAPVLSQWINSEDMSGRPILGRELLQRIGTEMARKVFGENFWIDQALATIKPGERIVITDVRFWNELQQIRHIGSGIRLIPGHLAAFLIRLNRADRQHAHDFIGGPLHAPTPDRCAYVVESRSVGGGCHGYPDDETYCNLPLTSHPSHYSGDTHESETALPDSGDCYDATFVSDCGLDAAMQVLSYVKGILHDEVAER